MRMIYAIFGILVIMFLVGGCLFKYFDWQYYKCKSLAKKKVEYIVNEKMYEILTKKQGGVTFVVDREYDFIESTNYGCIKSVVDEKYCFLDKINQETMMCDDEYLVYYRKIFVYQNPDFWIMSDEGSGFGIKWHNSLRCSNEQKFTFKDNKWQQIKK
ncbi:MAG: hypothetical protein MR591_06825 [Helicobacter sp.]|uniref:hypothetical protein n=1 Tax=Helicobacter sp. TaxID=218 RepID=UPI0037536C0F|nr:hypothetical protein [Helicobacter sp.]